MITSRRPISDGEINLIETVLIEPKQITIEQANAIGFKQFACQVGEKVIKQGKMGRVEPVYFEFNAPTYKAAFEHARTHFEAEKQALRKKAHEQAAKNALLMPPTQAEANRFKLNGH